jgi:hypothetical protein
MQFAGCAGIHVDFITSSDLSRRNLTVKPEATEWRVLQSHIYGNSFQLVRTLKDERAEDDGFKQVSSSGSPSASSQSVQISD